MVEARQRSSVVADRVAIVAGYQRVGCFALADDDTAAYGAGVVVDAVVGNFEIVAPAVYIDSAAALRAVGDAQPVNARRIALEVTGVRILVTVTAIVGRQLNGGHRELALMSDERTCRIILSSSENVHSRRIFDTFCQNRDPGSLVGSQ